MARIVHFVLHVPKCAGTTVGWHFRRHLGAGYLLAPRWESPMRNLIGNRYPGLDAAALAQVKVASGHSLSVGLKHFFTGATIRESVLIREPVGFLLSFYNYRWARFVDGTGPKPPEFEVWLRTQRRNPVTRFLLNRYFEQGAPAIYRLSSSARLRFLEERLRRFHFVGGHRRAAEMTGGISADLGISAEVQSENVTPVRKIGACDLPEALLGLIRDRNRLDQVLFDRWAERGWEGGPSGNPAWLPTLDQPRYMLGDTVSGIRKKMWR